MSKRLIGIIGAMDIEVNSLIKSMKHKRTKTVGSIDFVKGKIGKKSVVVAKCGIGKVFAGICAQAMILEYKPSVIINTGVAGSLTKGFNVLDVAIASQVVQHDMDTSALGDPRGMISGINVVYINSCKEASEFLKLAAKDIDGSVKEGIIASGDKFVADDSEKQSINEQFNAIACEMEGAAIGQACYVNGVPFGILRTISDGDGAEMDYQTFAPRAAEQSIKIVKKFIDIY